MWEKDKMILKAFRECYANMNESLKAGEEVDFSSTCVDETEALASYTIYHINYYKNNTGQELNFRRHGYFNPKIPYFQNF